MTERAPSSEPELDAPPVDAGLDEERLPPGSMAGEYRLGEPLGAGGFGTIYRAVHPLIGKAAAVKVLSRICSAQPEIVARFRAEARAVNEIRHRSIIDIFAFGTLADGRHYFVMELLEGRSLGELLRERGRLTMAEALPVLDSLADALDAAHARGVVHRDLKPDNVFLCGGAEGPFTPKLLDFGIAKLLGEGSVPASTTRTGTVLGSPPYMSPEQCLGRAVDHRTDVYSFGLVAYRMLTGHHPFPGRTAVDLSYQHVHAAPTPPSEVCPELPAAVDDVILWTLAKRAADRPSDLATVVAALRAASPASAAGAPAPAPKTPVPAAPRRTLPTVAIVPPPAASGAVTRLARTPAGGRSTRRRRRALWGGAAVALVGLVGVVAIGARAPWRGAAGSRPAPGGAPPEADASAAAAVLDATTAAAVATAGAPRDSAAPSLDTVALTLSGMPPGTSVTIAGQGLVGTAPGVVRVPRGRAAISIELRAPGHATRRERLVPSGDLELRLPLTPRPRRPPGIDDIEDHP